MNHRTRQKLAYLSLAILLIGQAMPALAVCVCDLPSGDACCRTSLPEAESPAESGCCTSPETPGSQDPKGCADGSPEEEALAGWYAKACQKSISSSEPAVVIVPDRAETARQFGGCEAVFVAESLAVSTEGHPSPGFLRGPPGGATSAPIFLLKATFLI